MNPCRTWVNLKRKRNAARFASENAQRKEFELCLPRDEFSETNLRFLYASVSLWLKLLRVFLTDDFLGKSI